MRVVPLHDVLLCLSQTPNKDDVGALLLLSLPTLSAVGMGLEVVWVIMYTGGRLRLLQVKSEFKN